MVDDPQGEGVIAPVHPRLDLEPVAPGLPPGSLHSVHPGIPLAYGVNITPGQFRLLTTMGTVFD
jgi:hypothetical protein